MSLVAIGKRVVVEPEKEKTATNGGILLPTTVREDGSYQRGVIRSIGPRVPNDVGLSVGDVVVFERARGAELKHEGGTYIVLRLYDVIVKVN